MDVCSTARSAGYLGGRSTLEQGNRGRSRGMGHIPLPAPADHPIRGTDCILQPLTRGEDGAGVLTGGIRGPEVPPALYCKVQYWTELCCTVYNVECTLYYLGRVSRIVYHQTGISSVKDTLRD